MTEAEALNQPGLLYRHKKGGIYRLLEVTSLRRSEFLWKGQDMAPKRGEMLATYEHLWPHHRQTFQRPYSEFQEPDRFAKIIRSES